MDYSSMEEAQAREGPHGDRTTRVQADQLVGIQDDEASFDAKLEAVMAEARLVKELQQQLTFEYHQDLSLVANHIMVSLSLGQ